MEEETINFTKKHFIVLIVVLVFCSMVYLTIEYMGLQDEYNKLAEKYNNECVIKDNNKILYNNQNANLYKT